MMRLHHYDVTISYKKGFEMLLADTLSRLHLESSNDEATAKLRDETRKDQELQQVKSYIYKGWLGNAKCLTPNITSYFHIRDELTRTV